MIKVHIWYPVNTALDSPGRTILDGITDLYIEDFDYHGRPTRRRILPDWIDAIPSGSMERWGHAGIEFIGVVSETGAPYDDCYRAFWPGLGADWQRESPGRVITDLSYDIGEEGSRPTRSITVSTGLNEALVYRYWNSLQLHPLNYAARGFNCCSAVAVSIRDGFPLSVSSSAPAYPPIAMAGGYIPYGYSNPYSLEEWTVDLNSWLPAIVRPASTTPTTAPTSPGMPPGR
ncbi:MAG: hypothetical protein KA956_09305 [Pyrinomonadaceae bacterium]|nr:hypothetical protein [Acidobacteriota bacterium]MBK7933370.1 hypothetical protein [Acidobacteriota bacterium]MBP7376664.1 hypothetical protein [Pyrinomonadaceae bacterium]